MLGILAKPVERRSPQPTVGQNTIVSVEARMGMQQMCANPLGEALDSVQMGLQKFKIRLTRDAQHTLSANLLIRKMYSWRGYATGTCTVKTAPNNICLSVFSAEQAIGTLTLGIDSAEGMSAMEMYKPEVDQLRGQGRMLCEMTKLAVDQCVRSRKVLASLFHIAYIHARHLNGCTDILIEVNPRHVAFYERMLGFRQFGSERMCTRVNAPAVLLRLETDYVEIQVNKFGGLQDTVSDEKSLYPYFFSKSDEIGIAQRLLDNHQ